jgi:hypothetical protein
MSKASGTGLAQTGDTNLVVVTSKTFINTAGLKNKGEL